MTKRYVFNPAFITDCYEKLQNNRYVYPRTGPYTLKHTFKKLRKAPGFLYSFETGKFKGISVSTACHLNQHYKY